MWAVSAHPRPLSWNRRDSILTHFESPPNSRTLIAPCIPVLHIYAQIMAQTPAKKNQKKSLMVGVGLDSDGHKRVTTGKNFALLGGTQQTHEEMVEKAIKINEKLSAKGKQLEEVSREEFDDIAHSVGLRPVPQVRPDHN